MFVQVNTLEAIKEYFEEGLSSHYSTGEISTLFEITCEHFLGWNKLEQKMKKEARLSESELLDFHFTLKRLKQKEPIQYILEVAPFMGLNFKVSKDVLIPRPETEELVNLVIKNSGDLAILDIGTGSGCIPVSIKKAQPHWKVYATDISEKALEIASHNSAISNCDVTYGLHDILANEPLPEVFPQKFDLIISNPPYVRNLEGREMDKSVLQYEPHLALFVEDDDPLIFYRAILNLATDKLNADGKIYFEINQYLGQEMTELAEKSGFKNITVIKDINNNDRILYAEK